MKNNPLVFAVMILLLLAAMVFVGYKEGKRAADRWYASQKIPQPAAPIKLEYPVIERHCVSMNLNPGWYMSNSEGKKVTKNGGWEVHENQLCYVPEP